MVIQYPHDKKRCSGCKEWKLIPDDYYMRKRQRVNGDIAISPPAKCKKCSIEKAKVRGAKWREKKRATGELTLYTKRWNQNRAWTEKRRIYNKEYKAIQRRKQGIEPRSNKASSIRSSIMVPVGPFQEWIIKKTKEYELDNVLSSSGTAGLNILGEVCQVSDRTLRRFLAGEEIAKNTGTKRKITEIPLDTVDKCLTNEGSTDLWELYPSLYQ